MKKSGGTEDGAAGNPTAGGLEAVSLARTGDEPAPASPLPEAAGLTADTSPPAGSSAEKKEEARPSSQVPLEGIVTVLFVAALGVLLAGTLTEAAFYAAALLAAPGVLIFAADAFQRHLLPGNPFGAMPYLGNGTVEPALTEILRAVNPLLFFLEETDRHRIFYRTPAGGQPPAVEPGPLLIWILLLGILLLLCLFAMKRRQAEQAGFSEKNRFLARALTLVPLLLLSSFLFRQAGSVGATFGLIVAGGLFLAGRRGGNAAGTPSGDKPAEIRRRGAAILLSIFFPLVLFLVLALGARWGYGHYIGPPAAAEVRSLAVSCVGMPNALGVPSLASSTESGYYFSARLDFIKPSDLKLAMALHREFMATGKEKLAADPNNFSRTVVPFDIQFDYTLADGRVKRWYYDRARLEQLAHLLKLEETEPARESMKRALSGDGNSDSAAAKAFAEGAVYLADMTFRDVFRVRMTAPVRAGLLAAILDDGLHKTAEERYFPRGNPLAVLMFTAEGESDLDFFAWHPNNSLVHLYESDEKTLRYLRGQGLWFDGETAALTAASDPKEVERLILQEYDPYLGINPPTFPQALYFMSYRSLRSDNFRIKKDFGKIDEVRDPKKRAVMVPRLRSVAFLSGPGHLAAVKYAGDDHWVYQFLPEED